MLISSDENITAAQSLRKVTAMVVNNLDCQTVYGFNVINSNICTSGQGNVGPCGGDSGGPLTVSLSGDDVLVSTYLHLHVFIYILTVNLKRGKVKK